MPCNSIGTRVLDLIGLLFLLTLFDMGSKALSSFFGHLSVTTLSCLLVYKKKSIFSKFIDSIHWYARIPPLVNLLLPRQVLNQQDDDLLNLKYYFLCPLKI